jgi:hypothetical protein
MHHHARCTSVVLITLPQLTRKLQLSAGVLPRYSPIRTSCSVNLGTRRGRQTSRNLTDRRRQLIHHFDVRNCKRYANNDLNNCANGHSCASMSD